MSKGFRRLDFIDEEGSLRCPKCRGIDVIRSGFNLKGDKRAIKCRGCGRRSVIGLGVRYLARGCVCLKCGSEEAYIGSYVGYGFRYVCRSCGSLCVVEVELLGCGVEDAMVLFKELGEYMRSSRVMERLRKDIFVNGEVVLKRRIFLVRYVRDFEGFEVPSDFVGGCGKLLGYLLGLAGFGVEEFSKRSGMSINLLEGLLRGSRVVNKMISRELEVATGISAGVWLGLGDC